MVNDLQQRGTTVRTALREKPVHTEHAPDAARRSASLLITHDRSDDARTERITAAGEMDSSGASFLHRAVTDLLRRNGPGRIDINLRGVISLDAAATGTLRVCRADTALTGCLLTLSDPHPRVVPALQDAGLAAHIRITARRTIRRYGPR